MPFEHSTSRTERWVMSMVNVFRRTVSLRTPAVGSSDSATMSDLDVLDVHIWTSVPLPDAEGVNGATPKASTGKTIGRPNPGFP